MRGAAHRNGPGTIGAFQDHFTKMNPALPFLLLAAAPLLPASTGSVFFNPRDFGARGDGAVNDRTAIQGALDACARAGGGVVMIPAGTYRTGTIRMGSNTTLYLQTGAVLQSIEEESELSRDASSPRRHLIVASGASNVMIAGGGSIRGTGQDEYGWRWGVPMRRKFRSGLIHFTGCERVRVENVTLEFSESFTLVLEKCRSVVVHGVDIRNNLHHENTDGIDVFSCQDVRISDCHILAGDDAIVLKTTDRTPNERIVVSNCVLKTTCSGLKFGTGTRGDFRDIHFSNISISHGEQGIAMFLKDGGTIEDVTFSAISITYAYAPTRYPTLADAERDPAVRPILQDTAATFKDYNIWLNIQDCPILMDLNRRTADAPYGQVRDITFSDIQIRSRTGILIQGRPEHPIRNLRLNRIRLRADEVSSYEGRHVPPGGEQRFHDAQDTLYARKPSYFTVAHVDGFSLDGYELLLSPDAHRQFDRVALDISESRRVRLNGVYREAPGGDGRKLVNLANCIDVIAADGLLEAPGRSK
jgi:hypothetical protein